MMKGDLPVILLLVVALLVGAPIFLVVAAILIAIMLAR